MSTIVKAVVRLVSAVFLLGSAALLVTAAGATAQTRPAPPAQHAKTVLPLAGEFHPITNPAHSAECLQPASPDFRALIVQRACNGSAAQLWATLTTPSGGTHYRFLNTDGWCMSVDAVGNGTPVLQDECAVSGGTTVSNAEWNASATLPNIVTLQSRIRFVNNNFCLDEPGASGTDATMQLFTCNGTLAQRWVVGFN